MKTAIYFILTLCISCGCLIAATNTKSPWILFIAGFCIWILFFWGWNRRLKKDARRRQMERQFNDFMRTKGHRV
jgi:Flp pilus assembly protein TadB